MEYTITPVYNSIEGRNNTAPFSNVVLPRTNRSNGLSTRATIFNQAINPTSSLQSHLISSQNLSGELVSQVKTRSPSQSTPASILTHYQASDFGRNSGTSFQATTQIHSPHALVNHSPSTATPEIGRFPEGINVVRAIDQREEKPIYNLALGTSKGQAVSEQGRLATSQQQLNQWRKVNAQFVKNNPNPMRDKFRNFVYQKEAGGNPNQLVYWRKDEGFPSLGIAHFTWKNSRSPFPRFLDFAINEANTSLKALTITRDFNAEHKKYFNALRKNASGLLMLIDYHNFKGPGTAFGLKAVIRNMPAGLNVQNTKVLLDGFVSGAHKAIANWTHQDGSPPTEKVKRGFRNRIESYRQFY